MTKTKMIIKLMAKLKTYVKLSFSLSSFKIHFIFPTKSKIKLLLSRRIKNNTQDKGSISQILTVFTCRLWRELGSIQSLRGYIYTIVCTVLTVSSLWLAHTSSLRASEVDLSEKISETSAKFYKEDDHPLTHEFWQGTDPSDRLKQIKGDIEKLKEKFVNYKLTTIKINPSDIEKYRGIFKCSEDKKDFTLLGCELYLMTKNDVPEELYPEHTPALIQLGDREYNLLVNTLDGVIRIPAPDEIELTAWDIFFQDYYAQKKRFLAWNTPLMRCITSDGGHNPLIPTYEGQVAQCSVRNLKGGSGCDLTILSRDTTNLLAIKKFNDIEEGLNELLYSLVALSINPSPQELKMARIYDAILDSENCINLIMEGANTHVIHHFLSMDSAEDVVKACANYFSEFHLRNYHQITENIDRKKYIAHVARSVKTLKGNPLKEENSEKSLLQLQTGRQRTETSSENVRSHTITRFLPDDEQENFVRLVKATCDKFERNCHRVFRSLEAEESEKETPYFLTVTHGDAHGNNFFYNDTETLNGVEERTDSFRRVTMIDVGKIVRTYGDIGDPAEDVGRFLGSLWDWFFLQQFTELDSLIYHRKIEMLQNQFLETYLKNIKAGKIFIETLQKQFEAVFLENCNFYKFRFYRAVFNFKKDENEEKDKEIKVRVLRSWVEENTKEKNVSLDHFHAKYRKKESKDRPWQKVDGRVIHWLPDRSEEFIESAPEDSKKSYLTLLWEELHHTGSATLSSSATLAGMGGIGKTTLALECAHEALENNAYNLIYWLLSETDFSLIRGYKNLLYEIEAPPITDEDDNRVIGLVKEHLPRMGKCLLIYDNVPDPDFLKDKTPPNTDILRTSRCSQGWDKEPLNLGIFQSEDSVRYLLNTLGLEINEENQEKAAKLAYALGHFPLALSHAAHYIKLVAGEKVTGNDLEKYLQDFMEESNSHFEEHQNPFKEDELEMTYENLIGRTYRMSSKHISGLARKLMIYFAYLDADSIAKDIFIGCTKQESLAVKGEEEDLDSAFSTLSALSLIKPSQQFFSIHRLLQFIIRVEQEKSNISHQHTSFLNNFIKIITEDRDGRSKHTFCFYDTSKSTIDNLTRLVPHAVQLANHSYRLKMTTPELQDLYVRIGSFLNCQHRVNEAAEVLEKAHRLAEVRNDSYHILDWIKRNLVNTFLKANNLTKLRDIPLGGLDDLTKGEILNRLGKTQKAEAFYLRDLKISEMNACKFGGYYLYRLALTYKDLGEFYTQHSNPNIGLEFLKDALCIYNPPESTEPNDEAASTMIWMGRAATINYPKQAINYFEQGFDLFEKLYPLGNQEVAVGLKYYAIALHKVGEKREEAIATLKKSFEMSKRFYNEKDQEFNEISSLLSNYEQEIKQQTVVSSEVLANVKAPENLDFIGKNPDQEICIHFKVEAEQVENKGLSMEKAIFGVFPISISEAMKQLFDQISALSIRKLVACEVYHSFFNRDLHGGMQENKQYVRLYDQYKVVRIKILNEVYVVNRVLGVHPEDSEKTVDELLEDDPEHRDPQLNKLRDLKKQGKELEEELWEESMKTNTCKDYLKQYFEPRLREKKWIAYIPNQKETSKQGSDRSNSVIDAIAQLYNIQLNIWKKIKGENTLILHYTYNPRSDLPIISHASPHLIDIYHTKGLLRFQSLRRLSVDQATKVEEKGDASAQYSLGQRYYIRRDYTKAFEWYTKAALQNHASAQDKLGWMYDDGQGVEQDYDKAVYWYTKAAEKGNTSAQYNLGNIYLYRNDKQAVDWLKKAARNNINDAKYLLEWMYENGCGVDKDLTKATKWHDEARKGTPYYAFYSLGRMHENGLNVKRSMHTAIEWYKKSAESDYTLAKERLAELLGEEKEDNSKNIYTIYADQKDKEKVENQKEDTLQLSDFENLNIQLSEDITGLSVRNSPRKIIGHTKNTYIIDGRIFTRQNVSGGGMRCFFNAMGLEHGIEIKRLKSKCNDPIVRYMIANEIVSAAANPEQFPRQVKEAIKYTLYEAQRGQLNRLEEERGKELAAQHPDGNLQDTQLLPTALKSTGQEGDRILEELRQRALSLEAFNAFLDHHIGSEQMMVALADVQGDDGQGNRNANYTSIDAVAYVNNLGLKIYQPDGKGGLRLAHQFISQGATELVYLYHKGVHFQALVPNNRGDESSDFTHSKEKKQGIDNDLPPLVDD